jgi:uncharacterized protein (TIGR03435 family)
VQGFQVSGPPWINEQRFDIQAKKDLPATEPEMRRMMRTLLAERFKLVLHRETKVTPALILTVAKSGLKIEESTGGAASSFRTATLVLTAENMPIGEMTSSWDAFCGCLWSDRGDQQPSMFCVRTSTSTARVNQNYR